MQTTVEKLKQSRLKTTTIVGNDIRKLAEERALLKIGNNMEFKGFRQGKAPLSLIREKVTADDILEQALQDLLPEIVAEALKISGVKPIIRPTASVKSRDPLTVELIFVERPSVALKKPEKISIEKKTVTEVSPDEIEKFIRKILLQDRTENPVDRAAAKGDTVRMSLAASDEKGDSINELVTSHYNILIGSEDLLPELEPHLIGMKKDDKKTVDVTFPKDHDITTVRGKKVKVSIAVKEVAEIRLPELTADYIKTRLGTDRAPEIFRKDIATMLFRQRQDQEIKRREEELFEKVRESTQVDLAPELIDTEVRDLLDDLNRRLKKNETTMEAWLKSTGKKIEEVVAETKKIANDRIVLRFGMQELARNRKIEPAAEEIQKAISAAEKNGSHAGHNHGEDDKSPGGALYEEVRWELTMQKLIGDLIAAHEITQKT